MEQRPEFYHKHLHIILALMLKQTRVHLFEATSIQFNSGITFMLKANSELLGIKLRRIEHRSCEV